MGKATPPSQTASSPTESSRIAPNSTVSGDASPIPEHQTEATPETLTPGQSVVQARRSRRGVSGVTLLVSLALHGLMLGLPAPDLSPQSDLSIEPAPSLDRLDTVTFDPTPAVEPEPDPEPAPEPAPAPAPAPSPAPERQPAARAPRPAPPAPAAPAPAAPAPTAPAPTAPTPAPTEPADPVPERDPGAESEPSPAALSSEAPSSEASSSEAPSPDPLPDPPAPVTPPNSLEDDLEELEELEEEETETAEEPQVIAGVPVLPGGELVSDLPNSLEPTRLERYRQAGSRHPDILGQYLLRVPSSESPEEVFQQRYRDLFDPEQFRVEAHGALAGGGVSAPQYRLRRLGEADSQFITLERLSAPDQDKLLITIWRRLPS